MPEFTGTLNKLFTLERPSDASGSPVYTAIATIWGSLDGLGGIESPAIQASADFRIVLRYRDDITVRDRLVLGSRVFVITSPPSDPDGLHRELQLLVKEQI